MQTEPGSFAESTDIAVALAEYAASIRYQDLPPEVVTSVKRAVLDQLGAVLAGGSALGCDEVVRLVTEWGGKGESTLIRHGARVPSVWAALANAMMGHSLDYDDTYEHDEGAAMHPGVSVIPACLALAERKGGVCGRDFITALAVGIDVICRLAIAPRLALEERRWAYPSLFGYFGAAAGASKILGLGKEAIVNALGIAYSQAAGNAQCVYDGALTKRIQPAFSASGGVLSALLAARGITGSTNTFEGGAGLYRIYLHGKYDPSSVTKDLGERFYVTEVSFKPYPCCRYTHSSIDATLQLVSDADIRVDDVEKVSALVSPSQSSVYEPLEIKQKPRTIVDAQFSLAYTVATAICQRKVTMADFTPTAIKDRKVLSVTRKVAPRVDETLANKSGYRPGLVEIRLRNGSTVRSRRVEFAKGHPNNPMSTDEIEAKFRDCARHAVRPLSEDTTDSVIRLLNHLEELEDVAQVASLLA